MPRPTKSISRTSVCTASLLSLGQKKRVDQWECHHRCDAQKENPDNREIKEDDQDEEQAEESPDPTGKTMGLLPVLLIGQGPWQLYADSVVLLDLG